MSTKNPRWKPRPASNRNSKIIPFPRFSSKGPPVLKPILIFEDEYLAAFDKPSGLLTIRDRWNKELPNLVDLVHEEFSSAYANIHRIDRDTSGIVLFAKTKVALEAFSELFGIHGMLKEYVAITSPSPPDRQGLIEAPLTGDERHPGRMRVSESGLASATEFEIVERWGAEYALVKARPVTGRTHQIRVHLAHLGCPIVGDPFYGGAPSLLLSNLKKSYKPKPGTEIPILQRLALHAAIISFHHPFTKVQVTISSQLPDDLALACNYLRRWAAR